MYEEQMERVGVAANLIREERRKYNNLLRDVAEAKKSEYNSEDLMRLVGTLEAAYNHAIASLAADGDIYCLLKHISYAIVLVGELDNADVEPLYNILAVITDGRIEPCSSCKREEKGEQMEEIKKCFCKCGKECTCGETCECGEECKCNKED